MAAQSLDSSTDVPPSQRRHERQSRTLSMSAAAVSQPWAENGSLGPAGRSWYTLPGEGLSIEKRPEELPEPTLEVDWLRLPPTALQAVGTPAWAASKPPLARRSSAPAGRPLRWARPSATSATTATSAARRQARSLGSATAPAPTAA